MEKTISIVMPVKNEALYLRECLDSIVSQSFKDWELWICDDHSNDNTLEIIVEYCDKYPSINYLINKEHGIIPALNLAYSKCTGKYITRMDGDDIMPPKKLETLFSLLQKKGRGYVATMLNQSGTLAVGDFVVAGSNSGKVKALFDHQGKKVRTAYPSQPVEMLGLDGAPSAGERFKVFKTEQDGKAYATSRNQLEREHGLRTQKHITLDEIGRRLALGNFKELNIIVKGDVGGSIEALADSLEKLSTEEINVNILHKAVGAITESDVMLASASNAVILGFQVRPSVKSRALAEEEGVEIRLYSVIYKAIEELRDAMEGMLEPTTKEVITGNLEVKETFKITKVGTIAGCIVTDGKVKATNKIRLIREGIVKYEGELKSLKRFKDNVKDVVTGQDCGIQMKDYNDIHVGDVIESFEEIEIKRTLK